MPWWACGHCKESNTEEVICLDYNHSLLTDVPNEVFIYERTLEDLYLDSNRITDLPRQLFHCHGLKLLNLSDNELTFIPPAISSLENLNSLDLSKNSITTIPDTIKSCSHLNYLYLSLNPLERLPDAITSIVSLVELHLNDVYLEFLPANFGRLVNLKILELRENNLITLPKSMSRLVNLTRLDIGQNEFTELPEVVTNLVNLTELWIDTNRIRRLSPDVAQLRKLIHFDASNNNLERLPREVGYWTKIVEFCVRNNELLEIPSTIGNMKNLIALKLDHNQIQKLPDSIGKLVNLEELMLAYNELQQLPESIGLLRKLQVLSADENELKSIPTELGSCSSLCILSLRGNRLKSIPAELGHLSGLRVLNLVGNKLQNLPVSLLKLGQLAALWLSDNQSKPLVPLQQEYHAELSQMFLTCFMLPQTSQPPNTYVCNEESINSSALRSGMRHICFAPEAGVLEQPRRLSRAPTPYPKELRALARHARSLQRGLSLATTSQQQNQDNESAMQSPQDPIQIKEAKVTQKPDVTFSVPDKTRTDIYHNSYTDKESGCYNDDIKESYSGHVYHPLQDSVYANSDLVYVKENTDSFDKESQDHHESVVAREYAPPIREAKYIRTYNMPEVEQTTQEYVTRTPPYDDDVQTYVNSVKTHQNDAMQTSFYDNNSIVSFVGENNSLDKMKTSFYDNCESDIKWSVYGDPQFHNQNTLDNFKRSSYSSTSDFQTPQPQPPPYHIAAAYSLQAQYFNNLNSRNSLEINKPVTGSCYDRNQIQISNNLHTDFTEVSTEKLDENTNLFSNISLTNNGAIENQNKDEERTIKNETNSFSQQNKLNSASEFPDPVEKPPTFIQDKPSVGKHIIAPTPQRPLTLIPKSSPSKNNVSRIPSLRTPSPMRSPRSISPRVGPGLPPSPKSKRGNQLQKDIHLIEGTCNSTQKKAIAAESPVNNHGAVSESFEEHEIQQDLEQNEKILKERRDIRSKIPTPQSSPRNDNRKITNVKIQKVNSERQMKWMFGLHKNATVVQVALKKNPGLGFSIMEKINNGIYISKVHPNGPACNVLRAGDKILEVDSIDFTKMNQEQAVHVLRNTGPIVNLMISRTN